MPIGIENPNFMHHLRVSAESSRHAIRQLPRAARPRHPLCGLCGLL